MALEHRNLKNNWSTTLQADAAAAATTLSILQPMLDKLVSPNPSSTEWYMLTLDDGVQAPEIVRCTAKGAGTATVVRAQEGTTAPTTWATGTKVEIRATAELLRVLEGAQVLAAGNMLVLGADGAGRAITSATTGVVVGPRAGRSLTSGTFTTAVGYAALETVTSGGNNSGFGYNALQGVGALSQGNTAFGSDSGVGDGSAINYNSFFGLGSGPGASGVERTLCLGYAAKSYESNTGVVGSESGRLDEIYFGQGRKAFDPWRVTLAASAADSGDNDGSTLCLAGGKSMGSGAPGKVVIATSAGGAASGVESAWADRAEWDGTGLFWTYAGLKTGNPGLGAGTWKLGTVQAGTVALDTANYVEVNIGGSVVKLLKAA